MIYLTHVSPPLRHTHLPLRRLQSNPVRPALSFFFNGFLGFELESMASSSSSDRQNQEFNAFSGIEPACKRRKVDESSTLFDVFINHRGPDVKQTLATQLHNSLAQLAIRAFLDSQEKELGNSFPSTIETAIRSAKVHIAIFSKKYAESAWCLAELVLMLQSNAKIIPVFYEVKPWEVRHIEKGVYADAFIKHQEKDRYRDKLDEWKEALHSVSFIAGEEFNSDRDCQKIVEAVQKEVHRKTCLHVAEYPVGLNNLVEDFERRSLNELVRDFEDHCGLEERKHKAKVVGIFGMGGSGKTTLAKELFNRKKLKLNYNRTSFLFDVREASVKSELPSLQGKLLKDLFNENHLSFKSIEEGKSYLTDRLQRNPHLSFLIVIDDIDHVEQLNALRVMDVLNTSDNSLVIVTTRDVGVLITGGITYGYNLKGMDRNDAKELFCWHAFRQTHPCSGYEELVDDFLEVCGGLPLSLQVLGRHLHHRAPSYWSLELIKAKKMLPRDVKQRLKISFDALDDEEKQVFMDIACFFLGKPKCIAERVCEGSGWNTQLALETLKDKCLVEEKENFSILYNQGEIVLRMHDHLRDLGREMASEISSPRRLWRPQDLKSLELMGLKTILSQTNVRCFHSIFDKFMGSQVTFFLGQSDICFETSACLLWLQLEGTSTEQPSIPSWIPLQNLQCLKVKGGRLKTLWTNHIQAPSNLKELLILETSLKEFPDLLGISDDLENVFLDAQGLPIQGLSLLESFNMNLCSLRLWFSTLNGEATSAKRGKTLCKSLVIQNFKFNGEMDWNERGISCSVKAPMSALKKLEISGEKFLSKILISGIHYPSLESIKLDRVQNLLEVNLTRVKTLNCLAITHCGKVKRLAASDLTNLVLLTISHCPEFEELSIHDLSTRLYINMCPKMEEFEIKHCEKIQTIMLPTTPVSLSVQGCRDLQRVAVTGDLTNLAKLYISDCPKLEKLLDLAMSCLLDLAMSCLQEIEIKHCEKIQIIMLPTTLMSLSVQGCKDLQRVAGTGDLTKLAKLYINECPELEELPSLSRGSCLKKIVIDACEKLQNISGIEELHVSDAMRLCYCGNAVIRNCIHELKIMPQCGMEMIGRAVDGAESTLNRHLFSDANIGVDAVTDIGTQKTYVKWSKLSAVIGCFVVVVKSSNVVNKINVSKSCVSSDTELKVHEGEWIITTVACDDCRYRGLKKILDVYRRYGVMKKGCWVKVQKGEEGKSIGVLCTIVDRLHHS